MDFHCLDVMDKMLNRERF